jgi:hypothetical protein
MVLPGRFSQGTPGWYDNPTMPNFEDYANDPAGYDAAVQAWVASQNGGAAGTAPTIDPVTGWRTAGSQRMADMSQGEYDANYLNARANSAAAQVNAGNPDHPNAGPYFQLAMQSRNQVRPEQMQSAYNAAQAGTGGPSPILNDSMLNLLESFGYAPPAAAPPTGPDDLGPRPPAGVFDPGSGPVPLPHPGGDGGLHATPGRDRQNPPGSLPPIMRPPPGQPSAPGSPSSGVLPGSLSGGGGPDWWPGLGQMPPGVSPVDPSMYAGGGGPDWWPGMGQPMPGMGNPDTIARFLDFQKRKQVQMQPPIMPAGQGY